MTGGWQGGAFRIEDESGPAVLKWSDQTWWAPRVMAANDLVAQARAKGYPTPAWLCAGVTTDGLPYQVQDLVVGERFGGLDDDGVDAILDVIAIQRRIQFAAAVSWSAWMRRVVFADEERWQESLRSRGGPIADAISLATTLAAPYRDAVLGDDAMVHGDFSTDNLLTRGGRIVGVIDIEALGTGCASFDLLTPARQAFVYGNGGPGADRLLEAALRTDGSAFVAIAVATHVINILAFGRDHWPDGEVAGAAESCLTWINHVASSL